MEQVMHNPDQSSPCVTITQLTKGSVMRFHRHTWDYFPRSVVMQRFFRWQEIAAASPWLRAAESWQEEADELICILPALPDGFQPLPAITTDLDETDWLKLVASLAAAIDHLHGHGFVLGFFIPEQLYYHRESGRILLDIQPFPNAFPFVDKLLPDYPYSLLSPYARQYVMPKTADFYGLGVLLQWLALGHVPADSFVISPQLPAFLQELCKQLIYTPNRFFCAAEIAGQFASLAGKEPVAAEKSPVPALDAWLHPMAAPILPQEQQKLVSFLLKKENQHLIGLICEDEAARYDVYNRHYDALTEKNVFFMIHCHNLPYSCLRELIERTISCALRVMPSARRALQRLKRKFELILIQHGTGGAIVDMLAEWLFHLYREIQPVTRQLSFFYTLDDCERLDEDSQRVFAHFWETYGAQLDDIYIIFSGKEIPSIFSSQRIPLIPIAQKSADMYRMLLQSMLGKADETLLARLTQDCFTAQLDFLHMKLLVEEMVTRGELVKESTGWRAAPTAELLSAQTPSAQAIIASRLALLSASELDILRILICLPRPIRATALFAANGLSQPELHEALHHFQLLGLAMVYTANRVFVPIDVAKQALYQLPQKEQAAYYKRSLMYQQVFQPSRLSQLIELSVLAGDKRQEYYYLIRYFRQNRHLLVLERRKGMLENLKRLQQILQRDRLSCWDRLLYKIYLRLNQYEKAEQTAAELWQKTGEAFDRFCLMRVMLYTNKLDLVQTKQELFALMGDKSRPLTDRARAAELIAHINFFSPLLRENAEVLDRFYRTEFFPQRFTISKYLFAEFTLSYVIILFAYFPEYKEWASVLRHTLESMLSHSTFHDLLIELYNSYLFDHNVKVAHSYNQRQLELARRFGFKMKEEISHINGMEIALDLGDMVDYRHHLERAQQIGDWKRTDLREQFLNNQLIYACEWKLWDLFKQIEQELFRLDLSDNAFFEWEVVSRYAAFRQNVPLPPPTVWAEQNDATFFIDALYQVAAGNKEAAIELFQKAIAANGYRLYCGWAMRELITLLVEQHAPETRHWLEQLKRYLQLYSYDVFWPDYYRLSAAWQMQSNENERALLSLRRAANIYQLIEKADYAEEMNQALARAMLPAYLPADSPLAVKPEVQQLLQERNQLLQQSLDLQIIMQLSEQVTEELQLEKALQRLIHALFEYFPISLVAIDFQMFLRKEKIFHRASGSVKDLSQLRAKSSRFMQSPYLITLYQQGKQKITLEVYSSELTETKRQHMEHFLSFIKPHIANALLYMEMMVDNLTGFYQRRYFLELLQQELTLAKAHNVDLSLIMLDIDNFRLINLHGHQEGDRVLSELSDIIRGLLRQHDIPGRYGGEEMLLILPKTDGQSAMQLAREIRRQIQEAFGADDDYKVTVSVGVSTLAYAPTATVDELIRLADDAEIVAKKNGKNRVVAAWKMGGSSK